MREGLLHAAELLGGYATLVECEGNRAWLRGAFFQEAQCRAAAVSLRVAARMLRRLAKGPPVGNP